MTLPILVLGEIGHGNTQKSKGVEGYGKQRY